MVDRATQRPGLAGRGQAQIEVGAPNLAAPDVNKFLGAGGRESAASMVEGEATALRVLDSIAKYGMAIGKQAFENSTQEAYLRGASAAGAGLTEAQLETNPLTADWTKAGYRDTVGRLALSKRQAQALADLPKLAEQDPKAVQAYLDRSRSELEPHLQGMSRSARETLFGQLLTQDAAVMKAYGTERSKYIIGQQTAALATGAQTQVAALDSAKGDVGTYTLRSQEALTWAHSNIVMNQNLPADVKEKLLGQYLSYAVSNNHMRLYDLARTMDVPGPDGKMQPMLGLLPIDQQEKLSEAYQKALKSTELIRNQDYLQREGMLQAALADPNADLPAEGDFQAFLQEGMANGSLSPSGLTSLTRQYAAAKFKQQRAVQGAAAFVAGNYQQLADMGLTPEEGMKALKERWQADKTPLPARIQTLISAGIKGQPNAFKGVAEYVQPALTQLLAGQVPDEGSALALEQAMRQADTAEQAGQSGVHALILSGMADEQRDMYLNIKEGLRTSDMPTAIAQATERATQLRNMPSDAKRALINSPSVEKENRELVDGIGSRGILSTLWGYAKFWSADAEQRRAVEPFDPIVGGGDPIVPERVAAAKMAYAEELAWVTSQNPTLSADQRDERALAAVYSRTIPTDVGALILPRGVNMQRFFGIPANVGTERVGMALSDMVKDLVGDAPGARLRVTPQGTMQLERFDASGNPMPSIGIEPTAVAGAVERMREAEGDRGGELYGPGVTVPGSGGVSVTFNGANSAGIDSGLMLDFRRDLVKHEGVRDTPYADGSGGRVSSGVGINSGNTRIFPKDGHNRKWSKEEIDSTFRAASDDVAVTAKIVMSDSGVGGPAAFKLFGNLAYQSGAGFRSKAGGRELITALQARDRSSALDALHKTPAYRMAGKARQAYYDQLVQELTR